MLKLYIEDMPKGAQMYNDAYFDLNEDDIVIDSKAEEIMREIDGVKYKGQGRFYSKLEEDTAVSITELSTGCKTALNVYFHPDTVFYIGECGNNAKQVILGLNNGSVCIDYFFVPSDFVNDIEVYFNGDICMVKNDSELLDLLGQIYRG